MNYRIANWLYRHHVKFLPDFITARTLRRYCCELSPYARISGGLFIPHTIGIVIGHSVVIGNKCEIFQHVTIGSNRKSKDGQCMPIIGDNVSIGTGATIVGPIRIGDNVTIGANAYIDKDIPDNTKVLPCHKQISISL